MLGGGISTSAATAERIGPLVLMRAILIARKRIACGRPRLEQPKQISRNVGSLTHGETNDFPKGRGRHGRWMRARLAH